MQNIKSLFGQYDLKNVLTVNNFTQASTFLAILHFVSGTGILIISPDIQAQVSTKLAKAFADLFDLLAIISYLKGVVKLLYNERKHTTINQISTTAPVNVTGGAIVETK